MGSWISLVNDVYPDSPMATTRRYSRSAKIRLSLSSLREEDSPWKGTNLMPGVATFRVFAPRARAVYIKGSVHEMENKARLALEMAPA